MSAMGHLRALSERAREESHVQLWDKVAALTCEQIISDAHETTVKKRAQFDHPEDWTVLKPSRSKRTSDAGDDEHEPEAPPPPTHNVTIQPRTKKTPGCTMYSVKLPSMADMVANNPKLWDCTDFIADDLEQEARAHADAGPRSSHFPTTPQPKGALKKAPSLSRASSRRVSLIINSMEQQLFDLENGKDTDKHTNHASRRSLSRSSSFNNNSYKGASREASTVDGDDTDDDETDKRVHHDGSESVSSFTLRRLNSGRHKSTASRGSLEVTSAPSSETKLTPSTPHGSVHVPNTFSSPALPTANASSNTLSVGGPPLNAHPPDAPRTPSAGGGLTSRSFGHSLSTTTSNDAVSPKLRISQHRITSNRCSADFASLSSSPAASPSTSTATIATASSSFQPSVSFRGSSALTSASAASAALSGWTVNHAASVNRPESTRFGFNRLESSRRRSVDLPRVGLNQPTARWSGVSVTSESVGQALGQVLTEKPLTRSRSVVQGNQDVAGVYSLPTKLAK